MSQDIALSNAKPPALKGEAAKALRAKASDIADRIGAESSSLKIKGNKKGYIVVGDDEHEEIQLVIVDFVAKRTFYETPYRDGDPYRPPTCYGISQNIDDMTPHQNVNEIGGEVQNDNCKDCPLNQWKSDPNGGNGKACKERRVMIVLPPGIDHANDDFWELDVGPTSLKSFDKFVRSVNDAWGIPPIGAKVMVSMDQSVDYQKFDFSDPEPNEMLEAHFERMEDATKMLSLLEYSAADEEEAPAKRKPVRKKVSKKKTARRPRAK